MTPWPVPLNIWMLTVYCKCEKKGDHGCHPSRAGKTNAPGSERVKSEKSEAIGRHTLMGRHFSINDISTPTLNWL